MLTCWQDSTPSDLSMRDGDVVDAILGVLAEAELVQVNDLILRVSLGDGTYKKYRTTKVPSMPPPLTVLVHS